MKIALSENFKSLASFGSIDLPNFTVVVGLNGMGKTQLLEGIEAQRIQCDSVKGDPRAEFGLHPAIVRLTNASLKLQSEMFMAPNVSDAGKSLSRSVFDGHRRSICEGYTSSADVVTEGTPLAGKAAIDLFSMSEHDFAAALGPVPDDAKISLFRSVCLNVNGGICNGLSNSAYEPAQRAIKGVVERLGHEARLVSYEDASTIGAWGEYALFDAQLPRLFFAYRAERIANDRQAAKGDQPASPDWLDDADFQAKFGAPPWEQLSGILAAFGMNYRFAPPGPRTIDHVVLYFERLDDEGNHVEFAELSAGEKVLVILAVALLDIDTERATIRRPELLLLDEIDASLHASVLHQWLTTIQDKVVGELGIPCILTTHSPVTVALAPEASLFEMSRATPPLHKISQREALNKLTVGLPSMEVDFTQRRQVFVEAEVDAEAYDRLHTLMKAELQLPRSLHFLSTGVKKKDGTEQGTGCAAVKKIVGDLTNFGNLSTFGLLDWDGERESEGRVQVLAQGSHYAFDNVILNPLLIGLLLIRDGRPPAEGLPRFAGADRLDKAGLQQITDAVQSRLTYPTGAPAGRNTTQFLGGAEVEADQAFCRCNGHEMEDALKNAFPALSKYTGKGRGKLALEVVERVLGDYPGFCPKPFADVFRSLADADA